MRASATLKWTVVTGEGGPSGVGLLRGGAAVSFALALAPAVQQTVKGGRAPRPLHGGRRLQIHQVVVRLAHPGVLALMAPPEEELCALLEEAAWGRGERGNGCAGTRVFIGSHLRRVSRRGR